MMMILPKKEKKRLAKKKAKSRWPKDCCCCFFFNLSLRKYEKNWISFCLSKWDFFCYWNCSFLFFGVLVMLLWMMWIEWCFCYIRKKKWLHMMFFRKKCTFFFSLDKLAIFFEIVLFCYPLFWWKIFFSTYFNKMHRLMWCVKRSQNKWENWNEILSCMFDWISFFCLFNVILEQKIIIFVFKLKICKMLMKLLMNR